MESKTVRSKSTTNFIKPEKLLKRIDLFTVNHKTRKRPATSQNKLPRPSSEHQLKRRVETPKSVYIPSYLRTPSTHSSSSLRILSKERIFGEKSRILSKVQSTSKPQKKSLIVKLHQSSPSKLPLKNLVKSISFRTRTGSSQGKTKAFNQDDFFISPSFCDIQAQTLLAVLDGHGMYGHEVSAYVKKHLPIEIENLLPIEAGSCKPSPMMLEELRSSFSRSFLNIQKSLTARKQVDVTFSGTTVNLVYIHSNVVICANLGDSRAVIGRKSPDSQWNAVEISKDHKPDDDEELKRIRARGGRVEPVLDAQGKPVGPPRVWLKNEPLPGLAMSRSIGDFIASTVGVIAEPDIRTFTLTEDDKFLIMATDGVWEFVNSNACVRIVAQGFEKGNSEKAAEDLLKFAVEMWTNNEKSVDDITIIIVFFDLVNHSN